MKNNVNPIAHKKEKEKMETMEEEIWKPIVIENVPEGYQVSNKGNVKNKKGNSLGFSTREGYMGVSLIKYFRIHRLVLMAFDPIENMEEMHVHHKDGIKKNNKLENLEWIDNRKHGILEKELGNIKVGKMGKENLFYKGAIGKFDNNGILGDVFCGEISMKKSGMDSGTIYKNALNQCKQYKGYIFRRFPIGTKPEIGKKYDLLDPMFTQFFKYNLDDIPNKKYKQLELTL